MTRVLDTYVSELSVARVRYFSLLFFFSERDRFFLSIQYYIQGDSSSMLTPSFFKCWLFELLNIRKTKYLNSCELLYYWRSALWRYKVMLLKWEPHFFVEYNFVDNCLENVDKPNSKIWLIFDCILFDILSEFSKITFHFNTSFMFAKMACENTLQRNMLNYMSSYWSILKIVTVLQLL